MRACISLWRPRAFRREREKRGPGTWQPNFLRRATSNCITAGSAPATHSLVWQGHLKRRRRDLIVRRDRSDTNDTKLMAGDIVAVP